MQSKELERGTEQAMFQQMGNLYPAPWGQP